MPDKKKPKKKKSPRNSNARTGRKRPDRESAPKERRHRMDEGELKPKFVTIYDGNLAGDEDGFIDESDETLDI